MLNDLKNEIIDFINKNSLKIFILLLCVGAGLVCGTLFSAAIPEEKERALKDYVMNFCTNASNGKLTYIYVLKNQLSKTFRTSLVLTLCSMWYVLIPVILVNSFCIGFTAGFTLGFMSLSCGFGGFIMAVVSALPEFVIVLPLVLTMSVVCINKAVKSKRLHNYDDAVELQRSFLKKILFLTLLIFLGNIINSLVVAEFSKFAGGLIIR